MYVDVCLPVSEDVYVGVCLIWCLSLPVSEDVSTLVSVYVDACLPVSDDVSMQCR